MDFKFNPFTENLCLTETTRVTALENTYVRSQWFKQIDSGTSGTLVATTEIGTSAEFIADQWPDDVDMLVSVVTTGERPDRFPPRDAAGNPISATFNTSTGAWALSGTPNAYPVALIYCYRQKLVDFTDTKSLVDFAYELPTDVGFIVREESGGVIANHVSTIKLPDSTLTDNGDNSVSITIPHSVTTGQTTDDHHAKSHAHDGADGSGTVAHSDTTSLIAPTDDHTQYFLLGGRPGDQTGYGSIDASGKLNLLSTIHATKGGVNIADTMYVDENLKRVGWNRPAGDASAVYTYDFIGKYGVDDMMRFYLGVDNYFLFNRWGTASFIGPTASPTFTLFAFLGKSDSWSRIAFGLNSGNGYMLFGPGGVQKGDIRFERVGGNLEVQFGTSPVTKYVFQSGQLVFKDNIQASFGTGADGKIWYNGTNMFIDPAIVGSGYLRLGDYTGNSVDISATGVTTLVGTGRVKLEVPHMAFGLKAGAASPTQVLEQVGTSATMLEPRLTFSSVIDQSAHFILHMPADMDDSVNVEFHLMWKPGAGWTAGNYLWTLEYIVKDEDADSTTVASTTITEDVTPANATDFIETHFTSTIDANAEQTISCRLYRDVSGDTGDDTGNVRFIEFEYVKNKLGEPV